MARVRTESKSFAGPLVADELRRLDAYWRGSNYLSVGQIYLLDNPLLKEPLKRAHVKPSFRTTTSWSRPNSKSQARRRRCRT